MVFLHKLQTASHLQAALGAKRAGTPVMHNAKRQSRTKTCSGNRSSAPLQMAAESGRAGNIDRGCCSWVAWRHRGEGRTHPPPPQFNGNYSQHAFIQCQCTNLYPNRTQAGAGNAKPEEGMPRSGQEGYTGSCHLVPGTSCSCTGTYSQVHARAAVLAPLKCSAESLQAR